MKFLLSLSALLTVAVALPVLSRDSEPFNGNGIINVITDKNQKVGCLNDAMSFVTDTTQCATYNVVQTSYTDPYFGTTEITYTISTSAGACGDPFQKGSQYQEGGNRILLCGEGSDADNSYWGVSSTYFPFSLTVPSLFLSLLCSGRVKAKRTAKSTAAVPIC